MSEIETAPRDGRETHGSGREPAAITVSKSLMLTAEQARWLALAAADQGTSEGAILRGALDTYRRLHPTWVR